MTIEEERQRVIFENSRKDSDLSCYYAAEMYYYQCRFELDDNVIEQCASIAESLRGCAKRLNSLIASNTPVMNNL